MPVRDAGCRERIGADPTRFILKLGHQLDDVEDVLETTENYLVVAKKPGEPARLAAQADPRT